MNRLLLTLATLTICLPLHAGEGQGLSAWRKAGMKKGVDSLYIAVPEYSRIARTWNNLQFSRMDISLGTTDFHLRSGIQDQQSVGFAWRGLGLNAGLNLSKASQRWITMGINSNTAGITVSFQQNADMTDGNHSYAVTTARASTYFAFNHRKYSYNAAVRRAFIQKRSAGSVVVSANACYALMSRTTPAYDFWNIAPEEGFLRNLQVSAGIGYGYNFVFGPDNGFLFHIGAIPQIVFLNRSAAVGRAKDERSWILDPNLKKLDDVPVGKPGAGYTASTAFHYSWADRYVLGVSMTNTSLRAPYTTGSSIFTREYLAQLFFEFRF